MIDSAYYQNNYNNQKKIRIKYLIFNIIIFLALLSFRPITATPNAFNSFFNNLLIFIVGMLFIMFIGLLMSLLGLKRKYIPLFKEKDIIIDKLGQTYIIMEIGYKMMLAKNQATGHFIEFSFNEKNYTLKNLEL